MINWQKPLKDIIVVLSALLTGAVAGIYLYVNYFETSLLVLKIRSDFVFEITDKRLPVIGINGLISNEGNANAQLKDRAELNIKSTPINCDLVVRVIRPNLASGKGTTIEPEQKNIPFIFQLDFNSFYLDQNLVLKALSSIWFPTDSKDIVATLEAVRTHLDRYVEQDVYFHINIVAETENGRKFKSNDLLVDPRRLSEMLDAEIFKLK